MSLKIIMPAVAACAAAFSIALGAPASAEPTPEGCVTVAAGQVCGSTNESTAPSSPASGAGAANDQNGTYGPSGNRPPLS